MPHVRGSKETLVYDSAKLTVFKSHTSGLSRPLFRMCIDLKNMIRLGWFFLPNAEEGKVLLSFPVLFFKFLPAKFVDFVNHDSTFFSVGKNKHGKRKIIGARYNMYIVSDIYFSLQKSLHCMVAA